MAEKTKPFQFDLAETLFFHQNEGVSEMLGIALDPEISIETKDDYVSVRGVIALTGEYYPVFVDDESDIEDEDHIQSRYFKKVERDEDGVCEFTHHFPIDISIPHERIKNLEDLTVSIDHFDYHIPDARKLELEATIQIEGLEYNPVPDPKEVIDEVVEEEKSAEDVDVELADARDIHFDFKIKDEEEVIVDSSDVDVGNEEPEEVVEPIEEVKEEKEEKVINLRKRSAPEPTEEIEVEDVSVDIEDDKGNNDIEDRTDEVERVEQPTYLLGLFEQEEEERYSQMKIYIVQERDSLEQIAEKYQVSTIKLQQANQLDGTSIHQGQIIYVPEYKKAKK